MLVKARLQRILGPASAHDFPVMYPWQLFILHFNNSQQLVGQPRAVWTDRPLEDLNQKLFRVSTPNMNVGDLSRIGTGCLGSSWVRPQAGLSPSAVAQLCIDFLHNSAYNMDLSSEIMRGLTPPEIVQIEIPENYMDLPAHAFSSHVVRHFAKWKIWTERALNPKIEVCELGWAEAPRLGAVLSYLEDQIQ